MTAEPTRPKSQPGQRVLRLVTAPQEAAVAPGFSTPLSSPRPGASTSPALRRLQRDLEAARAEAGILQELLEELPAILERKFQLRLQALLAEQRQLELHNDQLHHYLLALRSRPALPAATEVPDPAAADSPITQGLGLRRALRLLHR